MEQVKSADNRTRVLFVCASGGNGRFQMGGAERFLCEMIPSLSDEFDVGAVVSDTHIADELRSYGVRVYQARPSGRVDLRYCRELVRVSSEFKPDVVSAHLLSSAVHARLAQLFKRRLAPRLVVTLHNSMRQYVSQARGLQRTKAVINLVIERLFRVLVEHESVAVSEFEASELRKAKSRGHVTLIYNSLPQSWETPKNISREEARERTGLNDVGKMLLYMGRLEIEKGADLLSDVIELLPNEWTLIVAGAGVVAVSGNRVMAVGHVQNPELYYRASDVVIVPSRVESFGRVALEAACSERPVVHTNVGGLAEVLDGEDGRLGWVCQREAQALTAQILQADSWVQDNGDEIVRAAADLRVKFSFKKMRTSWGQLLKG